MFLNDFPLISVIVPVYNVEKYLRRCVDSILGQTYPNLEIILVNDGSPDNSWEICQEYETTQPTVRALKKPNGGLSSARNFGLNSARGKYVGFIDSDDWIAPDMYMTLYELIDSNNAQGAQINLMLAENEKIKRIDKISNVKVYSDRNEILYNYLMSGTTGTGAYSVCRCLFSLESAKRYRFREGKVNEDIDYKYKVLSDCNKYVISDKICYYYFQSGDSTSSGILKPRDFDLYDAADELEKLTNQEQHEGIRFLGKVKKARTPFSLLCRIAYYGISPRFDEPKAIIHDLTVEHRKNLRILFKAPLPYSRKILAILLAMNINFVRFPLKLIKKIL